MNAEKEYLITEKTFFSNQEPYLTEVSFLLPYHDWCELQRLDCWGRIVEFLVEKENKHIHDCRTAEKG